jgi:hypothetical protein
VQDTVGALEGRQAKRSAVGRDPDPAAKDCAATPAPSFAAEPRRRPGRMPGELAISA